jgi:periplasmic divalent cation tolerance protein
MFIAWTTVATQADADRIAAAVVTKNLAVCVQVEGPISSHYRWKGEAARDQEFRLMFKVLNEHSKALEIQVLAMHPYDTPEWIVVRAEHVAEKYLSWATANSSTPPL